MTPYYILAPVFGVASAVVALYGTLARRDFPTGSIVPVVAVSALLFVATLVAAIAGGITESG